ncbi:hypothetical protein KKA95_02545 [Patescibacteria group bacterium]|nr:hypothetical protein [Patescibacteria group bacterium]
MAEDSATTTQVKDDQSTLNITDDTAKQFPELIVMIKESRSMDDEERQYWVDVLPIMSEEQIQNLRNILNNEKKQIEKANQTYEEGMKGATKKATKAFDEAAYLEKKKARVEAEKLHEQKEKGDEEDLLKELENI